MTPMTVLLRNTGNMADMETPKHKGLQGETEVTLQGAKMETVTKKSCWRMQGAPYQYWGEHKSQEWGALMKKYPKK